MTLQFGSVLLQLRELVKDLWYRNSAEKSACELGILKTKLELIERYGVPREELQLPRTALPPSDWPAESTDNHGSE
jgi:hypothetical protein